MVDMLMDVINDTIKVVPIIFVIFLLVDLFLEKSNEKILKKLSKFDVAGGSIIGIIPQCGIPVAMTNLYSKGIITLGMLMAVFLSSSDEALIIIGAHPDKLELFILLIGIKIAIGISFGYLINVFIRHKDDNKPFKETAIDGGCCSSCAGKRDNLVVKNIKYTLKIFVFLVVIGFVLNLGLDKIGEGTFNEIFGNNSFMQPIIAAVVGAIPSCMSSVAVTQGYLDGVVGFGALVAGLCANTGYGILVLFRELPLKQALKISGLLLGASILVGEIFLLLPMFKLM